MLINRGEAVICLAGRDKGTLAVVLTSDGTAVSVTDGKHHPLERPKTKNVKHVRPLGIMLSEDEMATNKGIRRGLKLTVSADL